MNEQLEPCPVCGAKTLPSVVPMYDDGSDASTASCFNGKCLYRVRRDDHNTLTRHAEIGRLVEEMIGSVDTETPALMIAHNVMSLTFTVATGKPHAEAPTLLDALRALAAKLGIKEDGDA